MLVSSFCYCGVLLCHVSCMDFHISCTFVSACVREEERDRGTHMPLLCTFLQVQGVRFVLHKTSGVVCNGEAARSVSEGLAAAINQGIRSIRAAGADCDLRLERPLFTQVKIARCFLLMDSWMSFQSRCFATLPCPRPPVSLSSSRASRMNTCK